MKNKFSVIHYILHSREFTTALIVPDVSEGIEVQICLCPHEKKDITWHELRVFSIDGGSRWINIAAALYQWLWGKKLQA